MRLIRRTLRLVWGVGLLAGSLAAGAQAAAPSQPPPASLDAPAAAQPSPDASNPIVANVDGHPIMLSEVGKALQSLPPSIRTLPFEKLYPVLVDRLIDHQALVMLAQRNGIDAKPEVRQEIQAATNRILEGAWLAQVAEPKVTEEAIRARYNKLYARQTAVDEVHARHILVATEAEARAIIADLKQGADFATTAKVASKDADADRGGDLGYFRRDQVWPGLADAAFSLQPGQVWPEPLHNEFGWHVLKVEGKRTVAPPTYEQARDQIRQDLLVEAVRQATEDARNQLIIRRYNIDGTAMADKPVDEAAIVRPSH